MEDLYLSLQNFGDLLERRVLSEIVQKLLLAISLSRQVSEGNAFRLPPPVTGEEPFLKDAPAFFVLIRDKQERVKESGSAIGDQERNSCVGDGTESGDGSRDDLTLAIPAIKEEVRGRPKDLASFRLPPQLSHMRNNIQRAPIAYLFRNVICLRGGASLGASYSELWAKITSALRIAFTGLTPERGGTAIRKRDGSPLSEVDLTLQRLLVGLIEEVDDRPCVVAEEDLNTALGRERRCRRIWVIDPLDGTAQYLDRGSIEYCTTIAVLHEGDPVACLIYCPELGLERSEVVISVAGPGAPVLVNGSSARLVSTGGRTQCTISATRSKQEPPRPFEARLREEVKLRATSLTLDMVRCGLDLSGVSGFHAFRGFYRTNQTAWDALAGIVVACSSGLAAVDRHGRSLTPLKSGFLEATEPTFPSVALAGKDDVRAFLALLGEGEL